MIRDMNCVKIVMMQQFDSVDTAIKVTCIAYHRLTTSNPRQVSAVLLMAPWNEHVADSACIYYVDSSAPLCTQRCCTARTQHNIDVLSGVYYACNIQLIQCVASDSSTLRTVAKRLHVIRINTLYYVVYKKKTVNVSNGRMHVHINKPTIARKLCARTHRKCFQSSVEAQKSLLYNCLSFFCFVARACTPEIFERYFSISYTF